MTHSPLDLADKIQFSSFVPSGLYVFVPSIPLPVIKHASFIKQLGLL